MRAFIVDGTAGDIVRWLRALGFDTELIKDLDDMPLLAKSLSEDKILLSRSEKLKKSGGEKCIQINSESPLEIIRKLKENYMLEDPKPFTRCIECNTIFIDIKKEMIMGRVPPYIFKIHNNFKHCPGCGRIFWRGSHLQRMVKLLTDEKIIGNSNINANTYQR